MRWVTLLKQSASFQAACLSNVAHGTQCDSCRQRLHSYLRPGYESSCWMQCQVRECATALLHMAKQLRTPIFLVGHVTKTGDIAGQFSSACLTHPSNSAESLLLCHMFKVCEAQPVLVMDPLHCSEHAAQPAGCSHCYTRGCQQAKLHALQGHVYWSMSLMWCCTSRERGTRASGCSGASRTDMALPMR